MTGLELGLLVAFAGVIWWASTGAILMLTSCADHTYRWSMLTSVFAAIFALFLVVSSSAAASREGVLIAFVAAIVLWGTIEMAFLMGYVVGPRRERCPNHASGWRRFKVSAAALAYHEIALAAVLVLLAFLVHGAPNQMAFQLFALLWAMRLSTKLNIFLGVSNANENFLPPRISYLASYFRRAPMNSLFPLSVTAVTAYVIVLFGQALKADATPYDAASAALLATFATLALLEHWLLVLPVPSMALWPWAQSVEVDQAKPMVTPEPMLQSSGRTLPSQICSAMQGNP
jgi:putative photosynthetic complex assembly protein 2